MKEIPLTQGKIALVDDEDFDRVNQFKWFARKNHRSWYAARMVRNPDGTRSQVFMHKFLRRTNSRIEDHANGNGLDNRKENLRPATFAENRQNSKKHAEKSSKFKGVSWCQKNRTWRARIMVKGFNKSLGYFPNEIDAARAYDCAAKECFGHFACLNISA